MPEETAAPKGNSGDVEQNKGIAAIAYIWILFLIPLLAKKDSDFAKYHAKQGLVFFVFSTIVGFISWVPVIGWILGIFDLILFIMGLVNALSGKKQPLPVIGKFAEKINI
jgi:uncharacterized membrane protein